MKRIADVRPVNAWDAAAAVDFIVLDAQDRHRRRVVFVGERGDTYLLDLPKPAQLHDGDGLLLEDGSMVRVTGKPEPLIEVSAPNAHELARLAWHIGNRHTEVQIVGDKLRIRRDHVLEDMLRGLGATIAFLEASFEPESGAYSHHQEGHAPNHRNGR
jgi:urease accessory protein